MNTLEQAQASAYEASKGYGLVQEESTMYGLGWTVSLNEPQNTLTATYETEDGELITWHVDPKETGVLDNQGDLSGLVEDLLYSFSQWGPAEGWIELN